MAKKKTEQKEQTIYEKAQGKNLITAVIVGIDDRGVVDIITDAGDIPTITHLLSRAKTHIHALEERAVAQGIKEAEDKTIEG